MGLIRDLPANKTSMVKNSHRAAMLIVLRVLALTSKHLIRYPRYRDIVTIRSIALTARHSRSHHLRVRSLMAIRLVTVSI